MLCFPEVIAKIAISLDGCLDDIASARRVFSSQEDLQQVDFLRSQVDAILVGAETIRKDNPSLLIKNQIFKEQRKSLGKFSNPLKITITNSGNLASSSNFFTKGETKKVVYATENAKIQLSPDIFKLAEVVVLKDFSLQSLLLDLKTREVHQLLVEGGNSTLSQFFKEELVSTFRVAISSEIIGEKEAPRVSLDFSNTKKQLKVRKTEILGETVVIWYDFVS